MSIEKLIRDGKVAIVISPEFGAGWSTWANEDQQEFLRSDKTLCELVEAKDFSGVRDYVDQRFGEGTIYGGGLSTCELRWVEQGAPFYIHEYDGSERLIVDFLTA